MRKATKVRQNCDDRYYKSQIQRSMIDAMGNLWRIEDDGWGKMWIAFYRELSGGTEIIEHIDVGDFDSNLKFAAQRMAELAA